MCYTQFFLNMRNKHSRLLGLIWSKMKNILTILLVLISHFVTSQTLELTWEQRQSNRGELMKFLFDQDAIIPNWEDLKDNMPFDQKKKILLTLGRQDYYNEHLERDYKEEYASHYFFVDLNNDGQKDILYNSADGADAALLMIWINKNGTYERILREGGDVLYVNWTNSTFLVDEPAMTGEMEGHLFKYQVTKTGVISDKLDYQVGAFFPPNYNKISKFRTINDNYNLRSSPLVLNEPCEEYPDGSELCGNLYLKLSKGTIGFAIAESTDETGRMWWLSKIDLGTNNVIGWVSSRYVEKY